MVEPLKGKKIELKEGVRFSKNIDCNLYEEEDIKSAVEWLKEECKRILSSTKDTQKFHDIIIKIDEAFEDVVK